VKTKQQLLDYQIPHVTKLIQSIRKNNFAVDLSDAGIGKSYCAAATAKELNLNCLVITPKAVVYEFTRVLSYFGVNVVAVRNYEAFTRKNKNTEFTHWVREYDRIKNKEVDRIRFHSLPPNTLIVFDEVHKCKGLTSIASELLISAKQQKLKVLCMSASAATNTLELKALGYTTGLHPFTNPTLFKKEFATEFGARGANFDPKSPEGIWGISRIHKYLFEQKNCASRIKIQDLGDKFPETKIMPVCIDLGENTPKVQQAYTRMETELTKLNEDAAHYTIHAFAAMIKARRTSELMKVPSFVDEAESHLRDGKSIAMFVNFSDTITALEKHLKKTYKNINIVTIHGKQSAKERQRSIDAFQNNTADVIICNIAAGGVGISLHDVTGEHPRVSIISPNYSAIQMLQALGRIHRANGKSKSHQYIMFAAKTIEEQACYNVQTKLNNLAVLNNGDMTSGIKIYHHIDFDEELKKVA
jgi:superfamily II DNA or RNA helicase